MRIQSRLWNNGPSLYFCRDPGGGLGAQSPSLHVFYGSGEGVRLGPQGCSMGGAPGLQVDDLKIASLLFADDVVLLTPSALYLQRSLD